MTIISDAWVAVGFPDTVAADEALVALRKAAKQDIVDLDDAAVVVREEDGTILVKRSHALLAGGTLGGSVAGTLVGALFGNPAAGATLGTLTGATTGGLVDLGADEKFTQDAEAMLRPGTSALFAFIRHGKSTQGAAALAGLGGTVLTTTLEPSKEQALREALAKRLE